MIIIINGSLGVGKSASSWALAEKFEKSVMLDADYIGAIFPRDYKNSDWTEYLYETIANLVEFHKKNNIENFVINYVFENSDTLKSLIEKLAIFDDNIKVFYLFCNQAEQEQRIIKRNNSQLAWELKRSIELNEILKRNSKQGDIGLKLDTSHKTVEELTQEIWNKYLLPELR